MTRFLIVPLLLLPLLAGCPAAGPSNSQNPSTQEKSVSPVDFGNGQQGSLSLTRQGTQISGELVISNSPTALRVSAFSRSLQVGSYALTGSFNPPRGFSMTGNFPAPVGAFQVSGNFPTQTEAGDATLSAMNETVTVELPALNTLPSPAPSSSSSPAVSASPSTAASPAAVTTKVWTEAELETVVTCFNANFNPKDPPSIGAYASGRARLNAYLETKKDVTPDAHQSRLNALGVDLIRLNHQYHFSCVN